MNVGKTVLVLFFLFCLKAGHSCTFEDAWKSIGPKIGAMTQLLGRPMDRYVKYYVRTSKDGENLDNTVSSFNPKKIARTHGRIFFLIHGWSQNRTNCPWYEPLTELLLKKYPDSCIVQVDWARIAASKYYLSVLLSRGIGSVIARSIRIITKRKNKFPLQNVVIIGHSLGAQIAGWAGKSFYRKTKRRLPRIIALDPAGPVFRYRPDSGRLDSQDADVVMVVHTDTINFGFPTSCGTIDFFPNGGTVQPGCVDMGTLVASNMTDEAFCSHRKSADFFIEALKHPRNFMATECESFTEFQEKKCDKNMKVSIGDWQTTKIGTYFLETTDEPALKRSNPEKSVDSFNQTDKINMTN